MFRQCFASVLPVFLQCFTSDSRAFHHCFTSVSIMFQKFSKLFQGCLFALKSSQLPGGLVGILSAQNIQHIGIFDVLHILIKAQQFLNFLAPENFNLLILLKVFSGFRDFEPHFLISYF